MTTDTVFTKKNSILLLIIILIVIGVGVITYVVTQNSAKDTANQAKDTLFAPGRDTPYIDELGQPATLDSYFGKIIVVNSWASWSPFSVQELQDLNSVAGEYKDQNVVIVAVNRNENRDQVNRFLTTLPPLTNLIIVTDTADYFYNAVGGYAMPESLIYDEAGTIVEHRKGALTADELRSILDVVITSSAS